MDKVNKILIADLGNSFMAALHKAEKVTYLNRQFPLMMSFKSRTFQDQIYMRLIRFARFIPFGFFHNGKVHFAGTDIGSNPKGCCYERAIKFPADFPAFIPLLLVQTQTFQQLKGAKLGSMLMMPVDKRAVDTPIDAFYGVVSNSASAHRFQHIGYSIFDFLQNSTSCYIWCFQV